MSSSASSISFPFVIHALGNPTIDKTKPEPVQPVTRTVNVLEKDEVLVRVEYASINAMDPKLQQNNIFGYPLPLVLGFDLSGVVVAVGSSEEAKAFAIGDSVFGYNFAPPKGGACFATHVVVKCDTIFKNTVIPSPEASTYGVAFSTAYESLVTSGKISEYKGKTIFIPGGAGGVGHFAIQIAKLYGLNVITSTSKQSMIKLLTNLKSDHIIDYSKQDVIKTIMELTNGEGVDLVYDSTYQFKSMQQSTQTVKQGGTYIKLGPWERMDPQEVNEIKQNLSSRNATIIVGDLGRYGLNPTYISQAPQLVTSACRDACTWYEQGLVRPHIDEIIPFNAKALQHALDSIKQGTHQGGKIVVNIQDKREN